MVDLFADIGYAHWIQCDMQCMHNEGRGQMRAKWKDILVSSQCVIDRQVFDISWIIEITPSFHVDEIRVILTDTLQATSPGIYRMALPTGMSQSPSPHTDKNASVDHGYKVGIGNVIEHVPRPRPIDTAEKKITVQCLFESIHFRDREGMSLDNGYGGRCTPPDSLTNEIYLHPFRDRIVTTSMKQAIEIVTFYAIIIYELYMLYSHAGQALRHDRTDAPDANDAKF
jgi:hypothetical protein